MKGTPPVKVIRRNSHFFDRRQLRHIDIEAQTKPDQQKNIQRKKQLEKSSAGPTKCMAAMAKQSSPHISGALQSMGRPRGYLRMKFGRIRRVNKNFSTVGVVKDVIFPSFSPISQTSNPFWGLPHHHEVGHSHSSVHIKFGRNLPVNKNFRAVGAVKNVIFPSFSLIFRTCNPL